MLNFIIFIFSSSVVSKCKDHIDHILLRFFFLSALYLYSLFNSKESIKHEPEKYCT